MFISRIFNALGIEEEVIDLLISFFDVMAISPKSIQERGKGTIRS
jgi:hypothetical protein